MNTPPDDTTLALWLEDELTGDARAAVEAWAAAQPDQLAARAELRQWKRQIASVIPAAEEPPHAEFFNSRIARAIRQQDAPTVPASRRPGWQRLLVPLAACAGIAFAFVVGQKTAHPPSVAAIDVSQAARALPVEPLIYTPVKGTHAEWINHGDTHGSPVIVLDGLDAIPDSIDLTGTASHVIPAAHGTATAGLFTPPVPGQP